MEVVGQGVRVEVGVLGGGVGVWVGGVGERERGEAERGWFEAVVGVDRMSFSVINNSLKHPK